MICHTSSLSLQRRLEEKIGDLNACAGYLSCNWIPKLILIVLIQQIQRFMLRFISIWIVINYFLYKLTRAFKFWLGRQIAVF